MSIPRDDNPYPKHLSDGSVSPIWIAHDLNLFIVKDEKQIREWATTAIDFNPKAKFIILNGEKKKDKSFDFLVGKIMQQSNGNADPAIVKEILQNELDKLTIRK